MDKQNSKHFGIGLILVVVIVAAAMVVKYNSKNHIPSLSSTQIATAKAQIETNWKTFFAAPTTLNTRENLLQNGTKFTQPIVSEFAGLNSAKSSALVNSVDLTSSTTASVIYTIEINGTAVLTNQKGEALLLNGSWVVSDSTLCQLLSLAGNKPSVCQKT